MANQTAKPFTANTLGCVGMLLIVGTCSVVSIMRGGGEPAKPAKSAEPDPRDITSPELLAEIRKVIRAAGYVCPSLNYARNRGVVPRGYEIKAGCGPESGEGVYSELMFVIVIGEDGHLDSIEQAGLLD